jgi:lysophospholipase L1-like esterase/pimeloyl-ACP methyl ester carboxylesterase
MKTKSVLLILFILFAGKISAQDAKTSWDNTISKNWPEGFVPVEIKSSADGKTQKAIFYKSTHEGNQPLIVSLHTWSGDYLQEDPLAAEVVLRGWNYIHPDFRGPNNNPEACGSEKVISDIEDAIRFALENGNVNENEVHIIGVSGGGYASLLSFMKLKYPVKSFSAYASISNLEDWYWECKGRGLKYAGDLEGVTTNGKGFDAAEAQKRSPAMMDFPGEKRNGASLFIYTGVHDGYTGSVPVTHSINMYNRLLRAMYPEQKNQLVSDSLKLVLLAKRMNPNPDVNLVFGERKVHIHRELPKLSLTIFEGTHEMIVPQALALIPVYGERNSKKLNILTIGDSNAAAENGWPAQLRKLLPFSTVVNKSVSGNTIGFDNLGQEKLNTLKNIDHYLDEAQTELGADQNFDVILIGLGTNDAKRIFEHQQKEVTQNLQLLIDKIKGRAENTTGKIPAVFIISPPPMEEEKADQVKYGGGNQRIDGNNIRFQKMAEVNRATFIDINTELKKTGPGITTDGVHLTSQAQFQLADKILKSISINK